jgi:hypothetical protein
VRKRLEIAEYARCGAWLWALAVAFAPTASHAREADLSTELACEPAAAPGRVRCSLAIEAAPSYRLSWVDALVVQSPSFARPLRSRIPQPVSGKENTAEVLLALVASGTGKGPLTVRARAVICPRLKAGACRPASREATTMLEVGR